MVYFVAGFGPFCGVDWYPFDGENWYTLSYHLQLEWDACCQEWTSVKLCATPDDMAETLLEHLTNYLEYKATLGRRELTEDDLSQVAAQVENVRRKLR